MPLPTIHSSPWSESNPNSQNAFDWDGLQLQAHSAEWIINLDDEMGDPEVARFLSRNSWQWQSRGNEGLPEPLKSVSKRLQQQVLRRTGIALLKCGARRSPDEARSLQLILGCEFGLNVTRTPENDNRPLFALQATQDPTVGGEYSGNGRRENPIGFHTDGSGSADRNVELLSMLCVRPARFGGQSRVANAQKAYISLPEHIRKFLAEPFPRENPFAPGLVGEALKRAPIFCEAEKHGIRYIHFSYHPQFVRNAIAGDRSRFEATVNALAMLEEALERFSCDINLVSNEIIFINNSAIAHDRRAFVDDPRAKRLLERFWAGTFATTE